MMTVERRPKMKGAEGTVIVFLRAAIFVLWPPTINSSVKLLLNRENYVTTTAGERSSLKMEICWCYSARTW